MRLMSPVPMLWQLSLLLMHLLLLLRDKSYCHVAAGVEAFTFSSPSKSMTMRTTTTTTRMMLATKHQYVTTFLESNTSRSRSSHNSILQKQQLHCRRPSYRRRFDILMSNNNNNNNNINSDNEEDNDIYERKLENDDDDDASDSTSSLSSSSSTTSSSSSSLSRQNNNNNTNNIDQPKKLVPNPYLAAIATPPPSELISQFANTASPRAKDAARATIAGIMGGLTSNYNMMMNGGSQKKGGYEDGFNGSSSSGNDTSGVGGRSAGGGVMDAEGGNNNANSIGGFTSKVVATGARLANLMFQLQMTGYMLRNAEYRIELRRSLGSSSSSERNRGSSSIDSRGRSGRMLPSQSLQVEDDGDEERQRQRRGRIVKGTKIKVRYGGAATAAANGGEEEEEAKEVSNEEDENVEEEALSSPFMGLEVEVDAKAYVSELRGEIKRLRDAIESTRRAKEEETQEDLLMYIRSLPPQELQELTGTMSPEVLEAMKGLVSAVLAGIGEEEEGDNDDERGFVGDRRTVVASPSAMEDETEDGEEQRDNNGRKGSGIGPNTVTEQSGEALARLCMWQLVVGYNLRQMEVREKLRASMEGGADMTVVGDDGNKSEDGGMFGVLE